MNILDIKTYLDELQVEVDQGLMPFDEYEQNRNLVCGNYLARLERKVKRGLISGEEVEAAKNELGIALKKPTSLEVIAVDQNNPDWHEKLEKLSNFYFRQIFGDVPDEDDKEEYENTILVGLIDNKLAGAVWLIDEPREDYKNCTYLEKLYVRDQFQRKSGLGSLLLSNALEEVPEGNCLVLHAWSGAIEFYQKNGFLLHNDPKEEGGEFFYKMVLPLTKKSFDRYQRHCQEEITTLSGLLEKDEVTPEECKESGHHLFSGMAHNLSLTEWGKYVGAIAKMSCNQYLELDENPFTMFLYKRLGKEHTLLDSNQK
jgi:GNAT superfamily N-acetyltransferase